MGSKDSTVVAAEVDQEELDTAKTRAPRAVTATKSRADTEGSRTAEAEAEEVMAVGAALSAAVEEEAAEVVAGAWAVVNEVDSISLVVPGTKDQEPQTQDLIRIIPTTTPSSSRGWVKT